MRKGKCIITLLNENRLVDRIARFAYTKGVWQASGYYPIIENKTGKEVGYFMCAHGNKLVVRFLSWITDYRGKDAVKHEIKY